MGRIISEAILSRNTQKLSKRKRQMPYGCTKKREVYRNTNKPLPSPCLETTSYTVSNVSYPQIVGHNTTNAVISFSYVETITNTDCSVIKNSGTYSIEIEFEVNSTHNSRTIAGTVNYHDITISYGFIQKGVPCEEKTTYTVSNVSYAKVINAETTSNIVTIEYIKTIINADCQTSTDSGIDRVIIECGENTSYTQRTISGTISWSGGMVEYSFIQKGVTCDETITYTVSNVSYPQIVEYYATNAVISFSYVETITNTDCNVVYNNGTDNVEIEFEVNTTHNSRTIAGTINYHDTTISYGFIQKGVPCEDNISYSIANVTYNNYVNCDTTANTIYFDYIETRTKANCETNISSSAKTVTILFDVNTSYEEQTISGTIAYYDIPIYYSFVQGAYVNDGWIIAEYYVDCLGVQGSTRLIGEGMPNSVFTEMEIDGVKQIKPQVNTYFECGVNHVVRYKLRDISNMRNMFIGCSNMVSVIIPDGVQDISRAFENCSGLTTVDIPNTVNNISYAFCRCISLKRLNIPTCVTNIDHAFSGCKSLETVNIPNSITTIADYTFNGCESLSNIEIPNSVTSIGMYAFYGCIGLESLIIPSGVTNIGHTAFGNCLSIKSIGSYDGNASLKIPNTIDRIDNNMFFNCSGLTSVRLPQSITSIGSGAFKQCFKLTDISLTDSITSIDNNAFERCYNLQHIVLPPNLSAIGDNTFIGCSGLTSIDIPSGVTRIGYGAFEGCSGLTNINIAEGVKYIISNAFMGCSGIPGVKIPNSVEVIGDKAFAFCSALTSVTIGNGVTTIGERAFDNCIGLTNITIGNSVASIDKKAFYNCYNLTTITSMATTEPIVNSDTFQGVGRGGILYVPIGSLYIGWMRGDGYYLGHYNWTKVISDI